MPDMSHSAALQPAANQVLRLLMGVLTQSQIVRKPDSAFVPIYTITASLRRGRRGRSLIKGTVLSPCHVKKCNGLERRSASKPAPKYTLCARCHHDPDAAPSPISDRLHRRLQPFRRLHDCSGCFRLERLLGRACTHWKAPPCHGAHVKRLLRIATANVASRQESGHCS